MLVRLQFKLASNVSKAAIKKAVLSYLRVISNFAFIQLLLKTKNIYYIL